MTRTFSDQEKQKLKDLLGEGVQVYNELDTLKEGLKDSVAGVAEELDLKPATLNRAIRAAYKADLDEKRNDLDVVEQILNASGR